MRQFLSHDFPDERGTILINGTDFKHFRAVRSKVGDMVRVLLPNQNLVLMTVAKIDLAEKSLTLLLCENEAAHSEQKTKRIWLFQFVPKASKFEQIVRQATECGVERIFPVISEFSSDGATNMNFRSERIARIIREARQQSGSRVETSVENAISVQDLCVLWKKERESCGDFPEKKRALVFWERNENTKNVFDALGENAENIELCALICGAEGGISAQEIALIEKAGGVPVHFQTNILRCETAALYGIAVVQQKIERGVKNVGTAD